MWGLTLTREGKSVPLDAGRCILASTSPDWRIESWNIGIAQFDREDGTE